MPTAADRLALQHQRDIATIAGGVTSVVISAALGADPMAIGTWYWGAVDGLISRIQVGYAQTRRSAMSYLPRHAALSGADIEMRPGSLEVGRLRERLRIVGPVGFKQSIAAGQDTDQAIRNMSTRMAGVADETVRDGDRDVIQETALHGRGVVGWRRRLAGRGCGFCSMLASRGAVYVSERRAAVAKDGTRYHEHCRCWAEPLYQREQEPASVRLLQRQWTRVTAGHSGRDAQRVWRRHWESKATPAARQRFGLAAAEPSGGRSTPGPAVPVRQVLAAAQSPQAVSRALEAEYARITGRTMTADLSGSVATAREHAEGVLRAVERNPEIVVATVRTGRTTKRSSYAEARPRQQEIVFSEDWSTVARRQDYLGALAVDARTNWHPAGTGSPTGIAIHEMGHLLDMDTLGESIRLDLDDLLAERVALTARSADVEDIDEAIRRLIEDEVSRYAATDLHELVAEAFSAVMANGAAAPRLSREIVALLDDAHRAGFRGSGATPALPSASDLSRLPVTRLRAMVAQHGITVPTGLRKPALVKLVDDLDSGVAPATARERAVASIVDERRGVADALTRALEVADGSDRALRHVATSLRRELTADQVKTLKPLLEALDAADGAKVRAAVGTVARSAKLRQIGEPGAVQRIPAGQVEWIGPERSAVVSVVRPGWETTVERRTVLLQRAAAQAATPEQAARLAPPKAAQKAAAARADVRDITAELDAAMMADLPGGERFNEVLRRQGFDARPVATDVRGVDEAIDAGGIELFRGSSPERARDLISGDLASAADSMGGGQFGTGIYTGGRRVGERFAPEGGLTRMALRPDARVITQEDLRAIRERLSPSWTADEQLVFRDDGLLGAALGYDALAYGQGPLATRNFVIFNRGALVIERTPVLRTADIQRLSPKALREYAASRGVVVPPGARKPEIVAALREPRAPRVPAKAAKAAPAKATAKRAPAKAAVPDLTGERGLSTDPAVRAIQIENRIRQAYREMPKFGENYLRLSDLRTHLLLRDLDRAEVDGALVREARRGNSVLTPEEDRRRLRPGDREAAIQFGGDQQHWISFEDPSPRPLPAAPAKKATPRKAPALPAPTRMSIAALKTEIGRTVDLDVADLPKTALAKHVADLRSGTPAAQVRARIRQDVIDQRRAVADSVAEVAELLADVDDLSVVAFRLDARLKRLLPTLGDGSAKTTLTALQRAVRGGNPAAIRRALAAAERKAGLTRVDASTMDRALMSPVGGTIRDGARVEVVRPGYTVEIGGERIVLAKAQVREAPTPAMATPAKKAAKKAPGRRLPS